MTKKPLGDAFAVATNVRKPFQEPDFLSIISLPNQSINKLYLCNTFVTTHNCDASALYSDLQTFPIKGPNIEIYTTFRITNCWLLLLWSYIVIELIDLLRKVQH